MTQEEPHTVGTTSSSQPNLMPPEFISMGKKRIKEFAEMQTELPAKLQEANRGWLERMKRKPTLRLTEIVAAFQE